MAGAASGACGVVHGVTPLLRDGPVYQKAAGTGWSGCIGVGGDAQVRARAGASALASALAAMLKDSADGDADELPFTMLKDAADGDADELPFA